MKTLQKSDQVSTGTPPLPPGETTQSTAGTPQNTPENNSWGTYVAPHTGSERQEHRHQQRRTSVTIPLRDSCCFPGESSFSLVAGPCERREPGH